VTSCDDAAQEKWRSSGRHFSFYFAVWLTWEKFPHKKNRP